jgi:hypothetical protein
MLAAKGPDTIVCSLTTNAYVWSKCASQLHGIVFNCFPAKLMKMFSLLFDEGRKFL